jgi:uncharacterized SAM-binding protein YcdF (DUF218 family)
VDVLVGSGGDAPRVRAATEVMRAGDAGRLVYSGILSDAEEERLLERLRSSDVPDERVVLETRSRNTRENGLEPARVVREHGWRSILIVTSAARALGCYRVGAG